VTPTWLGVRLLADLRRHRRVWLAVAGPFAAAVLLIGGWRLAGESARADGVGSRSPVEVVAYLRDDLGAGDLGALESALGGMPGVETVRRVSAGEALRRMRAALGRHARLLDAAEDGLLPPSLEIAIGSGGDAVARGHDLGERLRRLPGVIEVDELAPHFDARLAASTARVGTLRAALGVLVAALAGAALLSVIVRRPARRRDEIRLMVSLGFTRVAAFVPAIGADLVAALAGAGLGLGLLRLGWGLAARARPADLPFLSPRACALALASALILGGLAGYVRARVPDPADA
jgi:cell division protein FtsX